MLFHSTRSKPQIKRKLERAMRGIGNTTEREIVNSGNAVVSGDKKLRRVSASFLTPPPVASMQPRSSSKVDTSVPKQSAEKEVNQTIVHNLVQSIDDLKGRGKGEAVRLARTVLFRSFLFCSWSEEVVDCGTTTAAIGRALGEVR